jgi:hypothetical protein
LPGVLISSSFLSNAAWHTAQVNDSVDLAKQILPHNARRSEQVPSHRAEPVTPRQKTAQESSQPSKAAKPRHASQADAERAAANKEGATRTSRNAETQRRHARHAHLKSTDEAQHADNSAKDQNQATTANQETEPSPFLAILGDVLPQDAPASASGNANDTHAGTSAALDQFSSLSYTAFGSGLGGVAAGNSKPNDNTVAAGLRTAVSGNAGVADKTAEAAVAGAAGSSGAPKQTELSAAFDGAFSVKTQVIPSGPGTVQAQKQAEVAFAARIAERTTTGAALGLNDAQSTIAASRFDAASTGGQSGENRQGAPQSMESNQTAQPDPYGQAAQEQAASVPGAAQADDRHASSAPSAAVKTAGSSSGIQPGTGVAVLESHATTASTSLNTGTPVAATPLSTASAAGNSGPAKTAADERVPQFLEPQNESSQRAGETVRDISLKLTNQDQASVQVRLSERAGELHVSVRTPDAGLTRGLREGLSDLVGRLEQSGYRAETWRPGDNAATGQDQGRENPSQQHSSQQQNGGGSGTDSREQQSPRDQQQPGTQTPEWAGELESSLQRSNRSWLPSPTR